MHREEGQIEPSEHEPEVELPQPLVQQLAEHLGPPVVGPGGEGEDATAEEHIVEMRHHEIAIRLLQVGRRYGVHDAGEAANREHRDEPEREIHRGLELKRATPDGADPVEDLYAGRDRDEHRGEGKDGVRDRPHAGREHMVAPHAVAEERDHRAGEDHRGVAKERLTREDRQDLRDDAERRQDQDIDLGVAEDPEEVLPTGADRRRPPGHRSGSPGTGPT